MFYSRLVLIAMMSGFAACASTPEYLPADGADDYGHFSSKLEENRYRIVFNGGRSVGPNATRDYALLRAAELTLREGYDWFEIVDRETTTTQVRQPRTGLSYERAYYVERSCGLLGCTQSARPAMATRMSVDSDRSWTKHSHALEVVMGKGEIPTDGGNYYTAAPLATSLIASL